MNIQKRQFYYGNQNFNNFTIKCFNNLINQKVQREIINYKNIILKYGTILIMIPIRPQLLLKTPIY